MMPLELLSRMFGEQLKNNKTDISRLQLIVHLVFRHLCDFLELFLNHQCILSTYNVALEIRPESMLVRDL